MICFYSERTLYLQSRTSTVLKYAKKLSIYRRFGGRLHCVVVAVGQHERQ